MIALTLPHFKPLTKKSPFLSVPDVTIMLATGPLPVSIFDSKTIPVAFESKSVLRSKISAWSDIASINLSKLSFVLAEISTIKVSPDKSSAINSCSNNWFLIFWGSASGKSHLLMATTIGTLAALACLMDSTVWGFTPSSAATTRTTKSVNFDPLALISVKAACPGVSINVSLLEFFSIWYAPICWVMPPNSPDTTFALLSTSSTEVFPWSTWPITVIIGALFFKFSDLESFIFLIISSAFSSLIGLCPNSLTKYSAVSAASVWLIVTETPIPNKCLITLLDCSAILFASSLTVIASGILISFFRGFELSLFSNFWAFLSSFCLALFTDAKLLCRVSISSLRALDTVNFSSLFFDVDLDFLSLSSSVFNLFVALCSASLRFSKSLWAEDVLIPKLGLKPLVRLRFENDFLLSKFLLKKPLPCAFVLLSITTVLFPFAFGESKFLNDFLELPEIVNFVFLFSISHPSIFINNISCRHY